MYKTSQVTDSLSWLFDACCCVSQVGTETPTSPSVSQVGTETPTSPSVSDALQNTNEIDTGNRGILVHYYKMYTSCFLHYSS